jgi:tetratricopeptide (TPR) repeat protein
MSQPARKPVVVETPPRFAQARALEGQGRLQEAVQAYRAMVMSDPRDASAWFQLGRLLMNTQRLNAAAACYKRALEISPEDASAYTASGLCLQALDRQEESLAMHEKACRLAPTSVNGLWYYAGALRENNRHEESLKYYDAVLALEPDNDDARWERSLAYLDAGRFADAWEHYELRWKQKTGVNRPFAQPRWTGEDFKGKTLFIYEEQGFGDSMLCSRYFPLVKARGGRIMFECHKNLHRLMSAVPGIDLLTEQGSSREQFGVPPEPFDLQAPLMSLPGIFKTDLSSIPPTVPLFAAPAIPPEAAALLELGKDRFKVGIVWSGRTDFPRNHMRAATAERFLSFAEVPGVQLYSLQKGPPERQLGEIGGRSLVWDLGPHLQDFADTAAVLKQLDLVIMTDSSVAHLAGTMGRPIWNLLNYRPYWLYMTDRADCPWYPSMRLFRQRVKGDWDAVFREAAAALQKAVALKQAGKWPPQQA